MTSPLATRTRWAALGVPVVLLGCLALIAGETPALALVNESPSLPRGLYVRQPGAALERGAIVAIPQPAMARAYLADLGMPAEVLLIKRVAAIGGDRVCRDGARLTVSQRVAAVLEADRRGRRLPSWSGCRRLKPDELFVLGDTPSSFDSRYFGPVSAGQVTGIFRETVTW
ncbi:S26 family signal peptidase [Brevundimonas goettingensis]|uniref:S26 family signal peptidase n=1 Tax=Brevundimonas goettingensis TaxID=2774190 RepID=A0A975C2S7_9CAUL|nr:S26 family signal peptidase [Brevundimonas goettingensis]QTC92791.1 S26 family signal peptidase [Brevundimonas goettingensis]